MTSFAAENFPELQREAVRQNYTSIDDAIRDTWEFMCGEEAPIDLLVTTPLTQHTGGGRPLWSTALLYNHVLNDSLSEAAQKFLTLDPLFRERGEKSLDLAQKLTLATPDHRLTEAVTMLGNKILDTAYLALGPEGQLAIEKSRTDLADDSLSDFKKGARLIENLGTALKKFLNPPNGKEATALFKDNDRSIYHLMKLSPHYLAVLGDQAPEPTCLAVSMVLASYLKQCGVEYVWHAGVVTPKDWPYAESMHTIASNVDLFASTHDVPYPTELGDAIKKRSVTSRELANDWDPHSTIIFGIGNTAILYDPFQKVSVEIPTSMRGTLREVGAMVDSNPGLELQLNPDPSLSHLLWADNGHYAFDIFDLVSLPGHRRWERALDMCIISRDLGPLIDILNTVCPPRHASFASFLDEAGLLMPQISRYVQENDFPIDEDFDSILADFRALESEKLVRASLALQIFRENELSEEKIKLIIEQLENDRSYGDDLVQKLALWPLRLLLFSFQEMWGEASGNGCIAPHLTLELGNCAHRIGATALLDVSYGLGQELPMSFWAQQWSSQLPWLYRALTNQNLDSEKCIEKEVHSTVERALRVMNWRYRQIVSIIDPSPRESEAI